jgi:hypothetical protein
MSVFKQMKAHTRAQTKTARVKISLRDHHLAAACQEAGINGTLYLPCADPTACFSTEIGYIVSHNIFLLLFFTIVFQIILTFKKPIQKKTNNGTFSSPFFPNSF